MSEQAAKNALNNLQSHELTNLKAHAEAAEKGDQNSLQTIAGWASAAGVALTAIGGAHKLIKIIKRH